MKAARRSICALAGAGLLASTGASAHHSSAPHYDASKPVHLEGVVTSFEFVNPHAFVHVRVGADTWDCELPAAVMLRRQGWSVETLPAGEHITLDGIAARRDPLGCSMTSATRADGTQLLARGGGGGNADRSAAPSELADGGRIAGVWARDLTRRPNGPSPGPGPADRNPPGRERFTAAGFEAQRGYDQRFDDPSFQCSSASIVRAWSEPGTPTQIVFDGDRMTIHHEYMDTVRTVRLGTREHAGNTAPADFGDSIGWFDGDTLVIDTTGFKAGVLSPHPGILHSDALHVVERLSVDPDEGALHVAWTADDPKYFAEPFAGEFLFQRSPYAVEPYGCTVEHADR